jgi:transglutaminase-like putative cysteine protease
MSNLRAKVVNIGDGREGVSDTLRLMRSLVKEYKKNPTIRHLALDIVRDVDQKDFIGEAERIHAFVRDRIQYRKDIRGVETVQTPLATLKIRQGDCDDKSTLSAALLESIGHPSRFVAVGPLPNLYSHVLVETRIGRKWVPFETTEPVGLGWYPDHMTSRLVRNI